MTRLENLLGAFSLTVADRVVHAGRQSGLSSSEQGALVTLLAHPDRTVSWLGDVLALTSSGATRLVDRLAAAGWVGRSAGSDARQRRLRLTGDGEALAREVLRERDSVLAECVAALGPDARADLERVLERLVGDLSRELLPALRTCRLCDRSACRSEGCACPLDQVPVEEPQP
jgi:DNA-binding MarR family transcriptional regulator